MTCCQTRHRHLSDPNLLLWRTSYQKQPMNYQMGQAAGASVGQITIAGFCCMGDLRDASACECSQLYNLPSDAAGRAPCVSSSIPRRVSSGIGAQEVDAIQRSRQCAIIFAQDRKARSHLRRSPGRSREKPLGLFLDPARKKSLRSRAIAASAATP